MLSAEEIRSTRLKREVKLRILSAIITLISSLLTAFWMYVYGIRIWIFGPVLIVSTCLSLAGCSALFEKVFGVYAALKPIKEDPYNPINYAVDLLPTTRIAVLMPIYHEDPARVIGALWAMIEELSEYPENDHFEWFVLSDSRREDCIVLEEYAYFILREKFPDKKIYYRHRINNTYAKVGNMSDFFRRWGCYYKFCIVLDADSMVPAATMRDMARTIEGCDRIGLIQSVNYDVNSHTLHGRYISFKKNISERIGFAGEFFCKMGRCHNYGHNLILRTEAFVSYCALPVLGGGKFFNQGKPPSHDFFEAVLLEGAGYETWTMPSLVAFEDQLHNLLDTTKRELRWIHGAMDWLRLWNSTRLSSFGKRDLLMSALNYFHAPIGLVFFIGAFWGTAYMLSHPLRSYYMLHHYLAIIGIGFFLLVLSFFLPLALFVICFYKLDTLRNIGGIVKFIVSYILLIIIAAFTAPIDMILINLILLGWLRGKKMVWEEQNREGRTLTWRECFSALKWVSVAGGCAIWFFCTAILPQMNRQALVLIHMSWWWVGLFILPPAIGLAFAPVIVRFMSQEHPIIERMGLLQHPFERPENEYQVVQRTRDITNDLNLRLKNIGSFEEALTNPWFFFRHLASIPSRPVKTAFWKKRLEGKRIGDLTRLEKLVVFRNRDLWEMFFRQHYGL